MAKKTFICLGSFLSAILISLALISLSKFFGILLFGLFSLSIFLIFYDLSIYRFYLIDITGIIFNDRGLPDEITKSRNLFSFNLRFSPAGSGKEYDGPETRFKIVCTTLIPATNFLYFCSKNTDCRPRIFKKISKKFLIDRRKINNTDIFHYHRFISENQPFDVTITEERNNKTDLLHKREEKLVKEIIKYLETDDFKKEFISSRNRYYRSF